jgi:hypothetical protein
LAVDLATANAERRRKKSWKKLPDTPLETVIPRNRAYRRLLAKAAEERKSK